VLLSDGEIHPYPIDFSVYPYHLETLGLEDSGLKRQFQKTEFLNYMEGFLPDSSRLPVKVLRRALNYLKVPCVSIPAQDIFGEECVASKGALDAIYYLSRVKTDSQKIEIRSLEPEVLYGRCTNILVHEWHNSLRYLLTYAGLMDSSSVECFFGEIRKQFKSALSAVPCHEIIIPAGLDDTTYGNQLMEVLEHGSSDVSQQAVGLS